MVTSEEHEILLDRARERDEEIAANIHGAMRDVRDKEADSITAQLVSMVSSLQNRVLEYMDDERKVTRALQDGLARVELNVATFISAFPDGDAVIHRLDHEARTVATKKKQEFWERIKFTLVALGLTAATTWLVVIAWRAFLIGPK